LIRVKVNPELYQSAIFEGRLDSNNKQFACCTESWNTYMLNANREQQTIYSQFTLVLWKD